MGAAGIVGLAVAGWLALGLDQWSKRVATAHLAQQTDGRGPRLVLVRNARLIAARPGLRVGLAAVWLAALTGALALTLTPRLGRPVAEIGLGLALGGAAGNLLDTLKRRPVLDFIDLRFWPVFNVADVAITAGLVLVIGSALTPAP